MSGPRLRFAPSPTGYLHVGGARTALFNWLFVRQQSGAFVLRIEDTDAERNRDEWLDGIQSSMRWLGLDWDEYYRQSERIELYRAAADRLFASGHAYYCDCTREIVQQRTKANKTPGYDGFCRDRGLAPGLGTALRFRTPDTGSTGVVDLVRGEPVFEHATIEDFVVQRSDGKPIFILANVVDDSDMAISHVVRSEEHLPNTPKYQLLWEALGCGPLPVFAHLPLLVNEQRKKISKRRPEDRVELELYRDAGYLPEAMRNYLALLGWAPSGDREIVPLDVLVSEFRLEDVTSSPAFFDQKKLLYVNAEYIRALGVDTFVARSLPWVEGDAAPWMPEQFDLDVFERMAQHVQERVRTLAQVPEMVDFLFLDEPVDDERSWAKAMKPPAASLLAASLDELGGCEWTRDAIEVAAHRVAESHELKMSKAQAPLRVAVTGRAEGPPLWESIEALGRERTLRRVHRALERLGPEQTASG